MMKKMAAAGFLAAAVGGFLLTAAPAQAAGHDDDWPSGNFWRGPSNFQPIALNLCHDPIQVVNLVPIVVEHINVLGSYHEADSCINGPITVHVHKTDVRHEVSKGEDDDDN